MTHFQTHSSITRTNIWTSFRSIRLKMCPPEHTKGVYNIWPIDPVFESTWPIFKLIQDIIKANILIFKSVGLKMWHPEHIQGFSKIWPGDLVFNPNDPFSNLSEISSRQTFWPTYKSFGLKMWPLEPTKGFSNIWPSDLAFDPTWPIFDLVRDIIQANILTNFHEYPTENVASRAYRRFF